MISSVEHSNEANCGHVRAGLDPIAVLKRVDDLRKWQEEEKMKLLQAHEDQMQQFRIEQVSVLVSALTPSNWYLNLYIYLRSG